MSDATAQRAIAALRQVTGELEDRCLEALHDAVGSTGPEREAAVALERRYTRARRSIEKAIAILDADSEF